MANVTALAMVPKSSIDFAWLSAATSIQPWYFSFDGENAMRRALAVAIAGGAVSVALVDFLTKSDILTPDNAREILAAAQTRLEHVLMVTTPTGVDVKNPDAVEAIRIIGELHSAVGRAGRMMP
jgi:hypothetical protein